MLKPGKYISECDTDYLHYYRIILDVKEYEKSYVIKLIQLDSRYDADRIKMMFKNSDRITVKKTNCNHAIIEFSDSDFTIYPYRDGIPYYFQYLD